MSIILVVAAARLHANMLCLARGRGATITLGAGLVGRGVFLALAALLVLHGRRRRWYMPWA